MALLTLGGRCDLQLGITITGPRWSSVGGRSIDQTARRDTFLWRNSVKYNLKQRNRHAYTSGVREATRGRLLGEEKQGGEARLARRSLIDGERAVLMGWPPDSAILHRAAALGTRRQ